MKDYSAEEQGIEEPSEEVESSKEEDVYSESGREEQVENDEISPAEAGFMQGEEDRGEVSECSCCGKVIGEDNVVEKEINGKKHWFCCEECAEKGVSE